MGIYRGLLFFLTLLATDLVGQETALQNSEHNYFEKGAAQYKEDLDSAMVLFHLGLPYYLEQKDYQNYVYCLSALTTSNWAKGNFQKSKAFAQESFEAAEKYLDKDDIAFGSVLNNLAVFAKRKGNYQLANEYYLKSLELKNKPGEESEWVLFFNNLGGSYKSMGDYYESKRYYSKSILTANKYLPPDDPKIVLSYVRLANVYQLTEDLDTAMTLYQKALVLTDLNKKEDPIFDARDKRWIFLNMAKIAFARNEDENLQEYLRQVDHFNKIAYKVPSANASELSGRHQFRKGNYVKAEIHFKKSLQLFQDKYRDLGKATEIGLVYFHLANTYQAMGKLDKSLEHFQLAISQYAPAFNSTDHQKNPKVEDLSIDGNILKVIKGKADAQLAFYQQSRATDFLKNAHDTYTLAAQMLQRIRRNYLNHASKEILAENAIPVFEGALHTAHRLYEVDPNPALLEEIFSLTENSKAILLLESINDIAAQGMGGIPDSLLAIEKDLKIDITYYEQQLSAARGKSEDQILTLETGLFDLKNKHRKLIKTFENNYPAYHQLKYNSQLATISKVQAQLKEDAALIEYFIGESYIFIFNITKSDCKLVRLEKKSDFNTQVEALHKIVMTPPDINKAEEEFVQFSKYAHQLYQTLLAPLNISASVEELIIIPDDILSYIPFEVLLKKKVDGKQLNYSPEVLSYLLNKYQISYNYSASLFTRPAAKRTNNSKDFIGFAPEFQGPNSPDQIATRDCSDEQFNALNCNQEEVMRISELFQGSKNLLGSAASRQQFLEEMPQYRIAHFATHSCLDDYNPMENKIIMADKPISNYDLFNLQLNTELSVLSACQTGTGKLMRGEGVMSLSRGFIHAGCPSILMSLWSVEDCTTMDIMTSYYEGLKSGGEKDASLRMAKQKYLGQANKLFSHPFYWAPFVQFGKTEALSFSRPHKMFSLLGYGFLLFLAIFIASKADLLFGEKKELTS